MSSYWDASLNNVDILGGSTTTSIPFLFALYTFLHAVNYKNDHYDFRSDDSIGLDEARIKIASDYMSLFAPGKCKEDFFRVGIHKNAVLSPKNKALRLSCDTDSLDLVTYPWGGMAFSSQAYLVNMILITFRHQPIMHGITTSQDFTSIRHTLVNILCIELIRKEKSHGILMTESSPLP